MPGEFFVILFVLWKGYVSVVFVCGGQLLTPTVPFFSAQFVHIAFEFLSAHPQYCFLL